jgi:hypothetical protein
MSSSDKATAAVNVLRAIVDAIRDAKTIPSGHLYAMLMSGGCTLSQYQSIEHTLIGSGLVRKSGDLLHWNA